MSMMWMRMPGQTWPDAAMSFLAMWDVMTAAMMLPSLVPLLWRDRHAGWRIVIVLAGYFVVWTIIGLAVFPLGAALMTIEMQQPALAQALSMAGVVIVLIAGALQFTRWKARHLDCWRAGSLSGQPLTDLTTAWRYGLHLGRCCVYCCGNLMAILLVIGVMDVGAMAAVTAAITLERLSPNRELATRVIGAFVVGTGLLLIGRAAVAG